MDLETISVISGLISPGILLIWIWYTEKYRPERQRREEAAAGRQYKQADDATTRKHQQADSREKSRQAGEENSTGLVLELVKELVFNLIKIADGKSTAMIVKMDGLERQFGILIGYMARREASQTDQTGKQDWPAINEILSAAVKTTSTPEEAQVGTAVIDTMSAMVKELDREVTNDQ